MELAMDAIYQGLAELAGYPSNCLGNRARRLAAALFEFSPPAAGALEEFAAAIEGISPGRLEEVYTATFDLNPSCYPYAGYQLFGDGYKRGQFLVKLKEKYREKAFDEGRELADHLSVILRFMAGLASGGREEQELVGDCLLPVVGKMLDNLAASRASSNPYRHLLSALARFLEARRSEASRRTEVAS